jgi:glucosylceramidase
MSRLLSITTLGLALSALAACTSGNEASSQGGTGGGGAVGSGTSGGSAGKTSGAGGSTGGASGGTAMGGAGGGGTAIGGTGGAAAGGTAVGGTTGTAATGGVGGMTGGTGAVSGAGMAEIGGSAGTSVLGSAGSGAAGASGSAGAAGSAGTPVMLPPLVTSAQNAYWQTNGTLTESMASANVTVNDTATLQPWDGFGGAFNELGWSFLTSSDMQTQAITLLFSATDGAHFAWGRIPIGASDYAMSRYTDDDTGSDVTPLSDESNRPPADTSLAKFSLDRDGQKLIPYVKAAQAVNPALRFWASPWTPPVWMKSGYKTNSGDDKSQPAKKPSYYDGGNVVKNSAANLTAYAQYYTKFVQGYKAQGIDIEIVSPQNEPGYDQNYPSCLWDATTYTTWVGQYLGPAMKTLGVEVMLGTLSNAGDNGLSDIDISSAVLADSTAKSFLAVVGVQWGVLDKVNGGQSFGGLPVWATEHKCGNYPWCKKPTDCSYPVYDSSQAPNDQAYGVESWGYIRDAITRGKVTAYNAWNMVLDKNGLGIDTTRDWKQDALLVADAGKINPTPAYYVFRHFSQYVMPNATVVGTTGGDAVAFKNPDGSLVAVMFNSGATNGNYVVAIGGKKFQFSMPGNGWATVKYKP